MKQMRSNFNNHIKVKLKPEGIKIFLEYYDYRIVPKIDDEGYTEMQIHEFMNIFGDTMQMGRIPVVDMYFYIECEEEPADK